MKRIFQLINKNIGLSHVVGFLKPKPPEQKPLITISREFGSSGSIIAEEVAKKLGKRWRVYHEQIVDQIAKETHLDKRVIKEVDESRVPTLEEMIDDFFGKQHLSLKTYSRHLTHVLEEIGKRGYAIIVGRGAEYIFPETLNVRIIGDMKYRVATIMKHRKVTAETAAKMIATADRKRIEFVRRLFNHDPRKAHHYDLTIRTSHELSPETISGIIVEAAKRRFKL